MSEPGRITLTAEEQTMPERIDTKQIADYLQRSREYVTDRLTKRPDFPRPVIDRSRRLRFWLRADVEEWARGGKGSE